ncbi:hypothetical protein [Lewinella sp. IMCC34183]|uniref:hypothetical protein n=1 Tax=Lewinella sp. IMCC34183 TaxID=2248762 RepID=UPI0018E546DC|nr:hypothetical protein [Lewinella sp. IMCC34183]
MERDRTDHLRRELLELANDHFPAAARRGGYPIVHNHCFLRVVYDNLFSEKWQRVLDPKKAAIRQLDETQLRRAIDLGKQVLADPATCKILNERSLRWRRGG